MTYRITIPDFRFTPLNQLGWHWGKRSRLKKQDRDFVWAYSLLLGIPQATTKRRVSLEITITGRQQETDPDALWKSCLDALVKNSRLMDDSAKWCELGTVTYTRGEKTETVIVLEDIG